MNQFLIVCPLLFLAGFLDAIGGGGGLISLPAYLLAGLPVHSAIATNKLSGSCGTTLATVKFIRRGLVNWRLAVPTVLAAMLGSFLGAKSSMAVQEQVMEKLLLLVLPCAAAIVLKSRGFRETGELRLDRKTWATALVSAAVVGFYDGFYGPGTGTFLIIAFTAFAHVPPVPGQRPRQGHQPDHQSDQSGRIFDRGTGGIYPGPGRSGLQYAGQFPGG